MSLITDGPRLAAALTDSATTLTLQADKAGELPDCKAGDYYYAQLLSDDDSYLEIVKIVKHGEYARIERAQKDTTAKAFPAGTRVMAYSLKDVVPARFVSSWLILGINDPEKFAALSEALYERAPTRRSRAYEKLCGMNCGPTLKGMTRISKRDIRVILRLLQQIEMEP